ncbi:MAG: AAA family ATPase, partial [Anaerolineae bacterium]|nr:AAA family ATPase [Anaerolineae bacterium]
HIAFTSPVTFLVGENGSGKSTLLEALACAIGSITVGSVDLRRDATLAPARALAKHMRLSWTKKTQKGLFLRAEDYFGYVKYLAQVRQGLVDDLRGVDEAMPNSSAFARGLAKGVYRGQIGEIDRRYAGGLDERSHGESFLDFFHARFVPNGLYLLDEPEAPLSPTRQITLLALLRHMVGQGAQFIIATHSPILMAYPDATILQFGKAAIEPVAYDEVEHVSVTKAFLKNPAAFLRHLGGE